MGAQEINDIQWLHSMRAMYVSTADDKLNALWRAIRGFEESPRSPTAYRRLDRLLHNLIGSGGSYGLPEVSDAARRMLNCLKQSQADGVVTSEALAEEMHSGMDKLRHIFAEASDRA